jgi:hypothetical protein
MVIEGGGGARGASDGDDGKGTWRGASFHAGSMNNLAFTWKERGRNVEAVKLMHECVQSRDECSFLNIYNCVQTLGWYEVDVPRSHSSTGVIHVQ